MYDTNLQHCYAHRVLTGLSESCIHDCEVKINKALRFLQVSSQCIYSEIYSENYQLIF